MIICFWVLFHNSNFFLKLNIEEQREYFDRDFHTYKKDGYIKLNIYRPFKFKVDLLKYFNRYSNRYSNKYSSKYFSRYSNI